MSKFPSSLFISNELRAGGRAGEGRGTRGRVWVHMIFTQCVTDDISRNPVSCFIIIFFLLREDRLRVAQFEVAVELTVKARWRNIYSDLSLFLSLGVH